MKENRISNMNDLLIFKFHLFKVFLKVDCLIFRKINYNEINEGNSLILIK